MAVRRMTCEDEREYRRANPLGFDCEWCGFPGLGEDEDSATALWCGDDGAAFCSRRCATAHAARRAEHARETADTPCPICVMRDGLKRCAHTSPTSGTI